MIEYGDSVSDITPEQLTGFFLGWPNPPSPETHLRMLRGSSHVVLALDNGRVVSFVNAISDNVLSAYIPLLEVLPDYRRQGIGTELVRRMLLRLDGFYMIDVTCDSELQPFYERLGLIRMTAMMRRDFAAQCGKQERR